MEITFSNESIDYNEDSDFAYHRISEEVELLDDASHQLYFNLTPGTGVISSLMMLLAIDGDRKLYYYSQQRPNFKSDNVKNEQVEYTGYSGHINLEIENWNIIETKNK